MPTSRCLQHNISIISFWLSSNRAESGKWQMAASSLLHNINAVTDSCSTNLTAWILCKFHYFFLYIKCIEYMFYVPKCNKSSRAFLSVICKMYVFIRTIIMLKMCSWNTKIVVLNCLILQQKPKEKQSFYFQTFVILFWEILHILQCNEKWKMSRSSISCQS